MKPLDLVPRLSWPLTAPGVPRHPASAAAAVEPAVAGSVDVFDATAIVICQIDSRDPLSTARSLTAAAVEVCWGSLPGLAAGRVHRSLTCLASRTLINGGTKGLFIEVVAARMEVGDKVKTSGCNGKLPL
jgi:hypothetical protein